ncbi:AbgT family transporter [Maricaulis sp. D1M11]|uniref:AbgT family transporter n=1 Tax=Maricaulis sp. D1M11 TaxID=3076117 RepID=UPI0039B388B0
MKLGTSLLNAVERAGNRLPDPVTIFLVLILVVMIASAIAAGFGLSATHPINGSEIAAQNLFSSENIQRLLTSMPATLTSFTPLGMVLVVMLGAGVAERAGLFGAGLRSLVRVVPAVLLTPTLAFAGIMSNLAVDAGYVVLIPLGGIVYAAAGRHPIAGMATTFAGVSAGFSANLVISSLDPLLLGITQQSAQFLVEDYPLNIAGNYYFTTAVTPVLVVVISLISWFVIEPRLGQWTPPEDFAHADGDDTGLSDKEKKGLGYAGIALLASIVAIIALVWPSGILVDPDNALNTLTPFFNSIVSLTFVVFLIIGIAYGVGAGTIRSDRDAVGMAAKGMQDMGLYIVLAFAMAHFITLFSWSNLGLLTAIGGGDLLGMLNLPAPILMVIMVLMVAVLNLFIGSASAKWALIGPVLVPILMLQGISPEAATLAYRMGDQATNIITPLMPYMPLVLVFAKRYDPEFGLGSLIATMLPYSLGILVSSLALLGIWFALGLPIGPDVSFFYDMPAGITAE